MPEPQPDTSVPPRDAAAAARRTTRNFVIAFAIVEALVIGGALLTHVLQ